MRFLLVEVFHVSLVLASLVSHCFIEIVPEVVEFCQSVQFLSVLVNGEQLVQKSVSAVDLGVNQFLVNRLLDFLLFLPSLLIIYFIKGFSMLLRCHLPLRIINKFIIKVLQSLDSLNGVELVVLLVLPSKRPRIVGHLEHFELILERLQVSDSFVQVPDQVLAKRENFKLLQIIES